MRSAFAFIALAAGLAAITTSESQAQEKKTDIEAPKKAPPNKEAPKAELPKKEAPKKEENIAPVVEFDQAKADLDTIKAAGIINEPASLLKFFQQRSVTDEQKAQIEKIIEQFGNDDFDTRERASEAILNFGVAAVGLLRQAERTSDVEVERRCQQALAQIEKISTGALSQAIARQLARLKPDDTSEVILNSTAEVILNFLPLSDDEMLSEELRNTLAAIAMKEGKPNPVLIQFLEEKQVMKRGAAAEALTRGGDLQTRQRMADFFAKESENRIKMLIAVSLVNDASDKSMLPQMISLMPEIPVDQVYRAEEILYALAGENPPSLPNGTDDATRKKARDVWLDWWKKNEAKIDLAVLSKREKMLGFTLIMEMDNRGVGGRVIEVGPDGKERWKITNLQFPSDAIVLPGNRVIVAEHNSNRVTERDLTGKEIWAIQVNQPLNLQRLPNGNLFVAGRAGLFEYDRDRKQVVAINRPEYDIVSARKTRNNEYIVLTNRGQIHRMDNQGKIIKSFNAGRSPYWSGMELLNNGKVLFTQITGVSEIDLASGQITPLVKVASPSSCQKLPNGNILVTVMNRMVVQELDRAGKPVWEYKPSEANYRPWRTSRR